jgi:hypothetical protein
MKTTYNHFAIVFLILLTAAILAHIGSEMNKQTETALEDTGVVVVPERFTIETWESTPPPLEDIDREEEQRNPEQLLALYKEIRYE